MTDCQAHGPGPHFKEFSFKTEVVSESDKEELDFMLARFAHLHVVFCPHLKVSLIFLSIFASNINFKNDDRKAEYVLIHVVKVFLLLSPVAK